MEHTQNNLSVNREGQFHLLETAKWAKFLAIIGFVSIGLMLISGLFLATVTGSVASTSPFAAFAGFGIFFLYLIIGILYFLPCWYMFQMAKRMKLAVQTQDEEQLLWALDNQRKLFKFMGIFTLIILIFYGLAIAFMMLGGGIGMLMR